MHGGDPPTRRENNVKIPLTKIKRLIELDPGCASAKFSDDTCKEIGKATETFVNYLTEKALRRAVARTNSLNVKLTVDDVATAIADSPELNFARDLVPPPRKRAKH